MPMRITEITQPNRVREEPAPSIPAVLYHGTDRRLDVTKLYPLTHFGSYPAAAQRAMKKYWEGKRFGHWNNPDPIMIVYPVRLAMRRPFRIDDGRFMHHIDKLVKMLLKKRRLSPDDVKYIYAVPNTKNREWEMRFIEVLEQRYGYDGFWYRNQVEDLHQAVSFAIFRSEQVSSAGSPIEGKIGLRGSLELPMYA